VKREPANYCIQEETLSENISDSITENAEHVRADSCITYFLLFIEETKRMLLLHVLHIVCDS
jgi:hypothetical protein